MENEYQEALKEKLIIAGISELEEHGLTDFSLRHVAAFCGASCAAPYRHFKNKDEFILAIIKYINTNWNLLVSQIESIFNDDEKLFITEICIANIKFRIGNPAFENILMSGNTGLNDEQILEKNKQTLFIKNTLLNYFKNKGLSTEQSEEKTFSIQSYIFGAVILMSQNNNTDILSFAKQKIEQELSK